MLLPSILLDLTGMAYRSTGMTVLLESDYSHSTTVDVHCHASLVLYCGILSYSSLRDMYASYSSKAVKKEPLQST